jgi:uncharacterized repeat protein (TIGR03847 family)
MPGNDIEFDPVTHMTVDAIGKPGQRVFYIQAWQNERVAALIVEKVQVQTLAIGVEQFLAEIQQRYPDLVEAEREFDELRMRIQPPVDPIFRVGELSLAYDNDRDLVCLIAQEVPVPEEGEPSTARFWCTRSQIRAIGQWGLEVASRGRSICPYCGEPIEPEGHFCPKRNGHKH